MTAFFLFLAGLAAVIGGCDHPRFAVADKFVPVLNTADFRSVFGGNDGNSLALDRYGQNRALEFIALPGTPFAIENIVNDFEFPVYRVTTADYPYPSASGYYIDSRMVRTTESEPPPRPRTLPAPETIIAQLLSAVGTHYQWGSNRRQGIPEMISLYPPAPGRQMNTGIRESWTLQGLDCSGLLYEATAGWTPRNTSTLVRYGSPVPIASLDADRIAQRIAPLDLIVWKGHVMIILDRERLIESRLDCQGTGGGVQVRDLKDALRHLLASRVPLDAYDEKNTAGTQGFVIRRWHPEVVFGNGEAARESWSEPAKE
jgi:cell wall-associated NlpC family hydrolase